MEAGLITIAMLVVFGFGIYWVCQYYSKSKQLSMYISNLAEYNKDIQITLRKGLVARFRECRAEDAPWEFQRFAARVIEGYCGGKAVVTPATSDYGMDIRLERDGDTYLGAAKYCREDEAVSFQAVATIHSQIVKHRAKGGFVVTTGYFTPKAKSYANDLNINLIDGDRLVDMWVSVLRTQVDDSARLAAKHA